MGSPRRWSRWLVGLLAVAVLVAVARGMGEERRFAEVLRNAQPAWIAVILALQVVTYVLLAHAWQIAIARAGAARPRLGRLIEIALAELFTDQALPSAGVGGSILVVRALERRGVPARASAAAVVSSLLGLYGAQFVTVVASIVALFLRNELVRFVAAVAIVSAAASVAIPTTTIAIAAGARRLPQRVRRMRVAVAFRDAFGAAPRAVVFAPRTLASVGAMRVFIILVDGATLACALAAVGYPLPMDAAIATFVLASVVGSISFLPGGLGTFEAVATGLLATLGVPIEAAVPAILLMRGFSFWLPMVPGLWFARRELTQPATP